jgi:hypothetical protein
VGGEMARGEIGGVAVDRETGGGGGRKLCLIWVVADRWAGWLCSEDKAEMKKKYLCFCQFWPPVSTPTAFVAIPASSCIPMQYTACNHMVTGVIGKWTIEMMGGRVWHVWMVLMTVRGYLSISLLPLVIYYSSPC